MGSITKHFVLGSFFLLFGFINSEYLADTKNNSIINCLQKNKNEVLSEEQTNYDEDNYANSRIPKIWDCIHPYSSKKPFDKRK